MNPFLSDVFINVCLISTIYADNGIGKVMQTLMRCSAAEVVDVVPNRQRLWLFLVESSLNMFPMTYHSRTFAIVPEWYHGVLPVFSRFCMHHLNVAYFDPFRSLGFQRSTNPSSYRKECLLHWESDEWYYRPTLAWNYLCRDYTFLFLSGNHEDVCESQEESGYRGSNEQKAETGSNRHHISLV